MSDNPRVETAVNALRQPPTGTLADLGRQPFYDRDILRAVLIRAACPIVCVGHRQDPPAPDWHEWCEQKADAALAIIESVQPPQEESPNA